MFDSDKPTEITRADIDKVFIKMMTQEIKVNKCSWCGGAVPVREVGLNYICYSCEKAEREAGRPVIFTLPVRDAYFKIIDVIDKEVKEK